MDPVLNEHNYLSRFFNGGAVVCRAHLLLASREEEVVQLHLVSSAGPSML